MGRNTNEKDMQNTPRIFITCVLDETTNAMHSGHLWDVQGQQRRVRRRNTDALSTTRVMYL